MSASAVKYGAVRWVRCGRKEGSTEDVMPSGTTSVVILENEGMWLILGESLPVGGWTRKVRRGSGMLASRSRISLLELPSFSVSSEPASSVRMCFVGAGAGCSSCKALMDERGITIDVGVKLLYVSIRERSVLIDKMSF